jgi:hypothetical protein
MLLGLAAGFKTGLEEGLICNVCVGTHPGTSVYSFYMGTSVSSKMFRCKYILA